MIKINELYGFQYKVLLQYWCLDAASGWHRKATKIGCAKKCHTTRTEDLHGSLLIEANHPHKTQTKEIEGLNCTKSNL